jgi:O-antigen/teichoic acid export membrane protein
MTHDKKKLLNLSLRFAILGGKFLSIVSLAKLMTVADFGVYNLIVAYAAFTVLLYGLDFYAYTHRLIAKNEDKKRAIVSHATFSISMLLLLSPFTYAFLRMEEIPVILSITVMLLFSFEYISQELYRYLVVENKQIEASIGLLLRTTAWMVPLLGLGSMSGNLSILDVVRLWLVGCFTSILYYLLVLKINPAKIYVKLNSEIFFWIVEGLKKSFKFLIATLALKLVFTLDRKSVQLFANLEEVAVYGFSLSFAMVIFTIVDATVLSYIYPKILSKTQDTSDYKALLRKIFFISLMSFPVALISMFSSVYLFNLDERYINGATFTWASIAILFYTVAMVPHYYLYSNHCDKSLVATHLFIALFSIYLFFGVYRTGEASVIAFKLSLIMLLLFAIKHKIFNFLLKRPITKN